MSTPSKSNNLALASFILGVLGLIGILPLVGSIAAIVLGHIARRDIAANSHQEGDSLALAGLITGYLGIVAACAGLLIFIFFFGGMGMLVTLAAIFGA